MMDTSILLCNYCVKIVQITYINIFKLIDKFIAMK
jgi:hypothetical protein